MTPRHLMAAFFDSGLRYRPRPPFYSSGALHRGTCRVEIRPRNRKYIVHLECDYWTVNGKLKTWKRDPGRFRLPIRTGGWTGRGDYITPDNVEEFHWADECPLHDAYAFIWEESGSDEPKYDPHPLEKARS